MTLAGPLALRMDGNPWELHTEALAQHFLRLIDVSDMNAAIAFG